MKFRPSNTCYLSCRIWLQKRFPAANVVSVQLEGERGNGALTHLWVLDGLAEGAFNREQYPRCALVQECHYGFTCQSSDFFLRLLLLQASISRGWRAWRETDIHSYVTCKGHAVCSRVKARTERNSGTDYLESVSSVVSSFRRLTPN